MILLHVMGDTGYPNRGADDQPPSLFYLCCWSCWGWCALRSLATEVRRRLALREGTGHKTVVVNSTRMSYAVSVAGTPKKEQLTLTHVNNF